MPKPAPYKGFPQSVQIKTIMALKQKTKKNNFNDNEREVLLSEVEARKNVLFKSVSTGVTGTGKKEAWDAVTQAVNVVSPEIRTVAEVKKNCLT